jgi:hypothetical protein
MKVVVVADMPFAWKHVDRGRASGAGSSCWACKARTRALGTSGTPGGA